MSDANYYDFKHYQNVRDNLIPICELTSFLRWVKDKKRLDKKHSPLNGFFYEAALQRIQLEGLDPNDYK